MAELDLFTVDLEPEAQPPLRGHQLPFGPVTTMPGTFTCSVDTARPQFIRVVGLGGPTLRISLVKVASKSSSPSSSSLV